MGKNQAHKLITPKTREAMAMIFSFPPEAGAGDGGITGVFDSISHSPFGYIF
jgi:hypothetical protein